MNGSSLPSRSFRDASTACPAFSAHPSCTARSLTCWQTPSPCSFSAAWWSSAAGAYYLTTTFPIVVLGGLGLWLLGRDAAHIGASGLLFGYFGFLVARGYYERRLGSIAVSIVVVVAYGGIIAGVLPRDDQVSWEAHLLGLIAGGLCARAALGRAR